MDDKAENVLSQVIVVAIAILFIATLGVAGWNILGNADFGTLVSAEQINSSTYPATITLQNNNLISGTDTVFNSTITFARAGNYTINYGTGVITTTSPTNLTNNSIYSVNYKFTHVDSTTDTLVTIVIAIIAAIATLLILLRALGVKTLNLR